MFGQSFEKPIHEFLYALSGLGTYLFIMIIFVILGVIFKQFWPQTLILKTTLTAQTFDSILFNYPLFAFFWINFLLFIFNLFIFSLPMDGGRLLTALISFIFDKQYASKIVPIISKISSITIIVLGILVKDIIIIVIGIFVLLMSLKETEEASVLHVLENKTIDEFITPIELIFDKKDTILDCFSIMKREMIPEAIIKLSKRQYAVLDSNMIANINKNQWITKTAEEVALHVNPATNKEKLGYIAQYMVEKDLTIMPVIHSKTKALIGIIKRGDLANYIKIHKIFD